MDIQFPGFHIQGVESNGIHTFTQSLCFRLISQFYPSVLYLASLRIEPSSAFDEGNHPSFHLYPSCEQFGLWFSPSQLIDQNIPTTFLFPENVFEVYFCLCLISYSVIFIPLKFQWNLMLIFYSKLQSHAILLICCSGCSSFGHWKLFHVGFCVQDQELNVLTAPGGLLCRKSEVIYLCILTHIYFIYIYNICVCVSIIVIISVHLYLY